MTPMRETFVKVLFLLEQDDPLISRVEISKYLFDLLTHARDEEESGSAANFAAIAVLYLNAMEGGNGEQIRRRFEDLNVATHVLTAVMLIRRGRLRGEDDHHIAAA